MSSVEESKEQHEYLTFFLADEEYATAILGVKEVIEHSAVTRVPAMPACIRGVINLRGNVVPVVDLAVKFGGSETAVTSRTCIVILDMEIDGERTVMGLIADAVGQVTEFDEEEIAAAPQFGTKVKAEHLLGMGSAGKKFVLILNIERLLSSTELLNAARVVAGNPAVSTMQPAGDSRAA